MYAGQKGKSKPPAKNLQEDLADTGVVVHCSTVSRCLHGHDLHGRVSRRKPDLCPHHQIQHQKYETEHLQIPDAFWKQVLWTDEVKIELFGHNQQRYVWRKKGAAFHEKTTLPTVKHGGGSIHPKAYALGLCCSQWHRKHMGGGKNGFH